MPIEDDAQDVGIHILKPTQHLRQLLPVAGAGASNDDHTIYMLAYRECVSDCQQWWAVDDDEIGAFFESGNDPTHQGRNQETVRIGQL